MNTDEALQGRRVFLTRAPATTAIFAFIERFHNRLRLHSSLDDQSPLDFEALPTASTKAA